jgi:hypothetical protein
MKCNTPFLRRFVHIDDGDVSAENVDDGASMQVCRRQVLLLY